jgi:hypothetical protein
MEAQEHLWNYYTELVVGRRRYAIPEGKKSNMPRRTNVSIRRSLRSFYEAANLQKD